MSQDASIAMQLDGRGVLAVKQGGAEVARLRTPLGQREPATDAHTLAAATDETVVARVQSGDREAFSVLVSRYQDRVYAIARSFVRDDEDALDLVQETFVKAYQGLRGFRGGSSFYTWLYRIAVNTCKDHLRKRACRPSVSLEDELLHDAGFEPAASDPGCDPAGSAERRELRVAVREAVALLPEKLRIAVTLHDIEGWPQQEVAAVLQCPLGTVKSHVFRGRARLRELLGRYVEG